MNDKLGEKYPGNTNTGTTAFKKKPDQVVLDTVTSTNEIVEAGDENIDWGTTTEKNERWISDLKENHEALFNQLKGKIQFEGELIIIDGMKFDSKPLDFIGYFNQTNNKAKKINGRRLPLTNEFEKLFQLFTVDGIYYGDECIALLSIAANSYWSSTSYAANADSAWLGNFGAGRVSYANKVYNSHVLCIND